MFAPFLSPRFVHPTPELRPHEMSTPWARIDLTHELRGLVSRPGREREQVKERVDPNDKIERERERKRISKTKEMKKIHKEKGKRCQAFRL